MTVQPSQRMPDADQLHRVDTVVVAAHAGTFANDFLAGCWDNIAMSRAMQEKVRFIAVYRTDVRAITHLAQIEHIEPKPGRPGYVILHFDAPQQIAPIPFGKGRGQAIQGRQYTNRARLLMATSLTDVRDFTNWRPTRQEYVRSLITQVVRETPELEFDQTWEDYIRIAYPAWDQDVDPMEGSWTVTGRMLLFTMDNLPDHLRINLMVGPGPNQHRERLLQMANYPPLRRFPEQDANNPYGEWTLLYEHYILDHTLFAEGTNAQIAEALRGFWAEFCTNILPAINEIAESIT